MNSSKIAMLSVLCLTPLARADMVYYSSGYVTQSGVGAEAYMQGGPDNAPVQYLNGPGPFNNSVNAGSIAFNNPSGQDQAFASATLNSNVSATGISAVGSMSWSYTSSQHQVNDLSVDSTVSSFFTSSTLATFSLTGTVLNGSVELIDDSTNTTLAQVVSSNGQAQNVSFSGLLNTSDQYYLGISTADNVGFLGRGSFSGSGSMDVTFSTAAVPEPSSLCLTAGVALWAIVYGWRRRFRSNSGMSGCVHMSDWYLPRLVHLFFICFSPILAMATRLQE